MLESVQDLSYAAFQVALPVIYNLGNPTAEY